jgi:hypothetical protein
MSDKVKPPQFIAGAKYLEIIVDETGETSVEAHNFAGQGCREATRGIERELGVAGSRQDKSQQKVIKNLKV